MRAPAARSGGSKTAEGGPVESEFSTTKQQHNNNNTITQQQQQKLAKTLNIEIAQTAHCFYVCRVELSWFLFCSRCFFVRRCVMPRRGWQHQDGSAYSGVRGHHQRGGQLLTVQVQWAVGVQGIPSQISSPGVEAEPQARGCCLRGSGRGQEVGSSDCRNRGENSVPPVPDDPQELEGWLSDRNCDLRNAIEFGNPGLVGQIGHLMDRVREQSNVPIASSSASNLSSRTVTTLSMSVTASASSVNCCAIVRATNRLTTSPPTVPRIMFLEGCHAAHLDAPQNLFWHLAPGKLGCNLTE